MLCTHRGKRSRLSSRLSPFLTIEQFFDIFVSFLESYSSFLPFPFVPASRVLFFPPALFRLLYGSLPLFHSFLLLSSSLISLLHFLNVMRNSCISFFILAWFSTRAFSSFTLSFSLFERRRSPRLDGGRLLFAEIRVVFELLLEFRNHCELTLLVRNLSLREEANK